jgi:hypothetical protein
VVALDVDVAVTAVVETDWDAAVSDFSVAQAASPRTARPAHPILMPVGKLMNTLPSWWLVED